MRKIKAFCCALMISTIVISTPAYMASELLPGESVPVDFDQNYYGEMVRKLGWNGEWFFRNSDRTLIDSAGEYLEEIHEAMIQGGYSSADMGGYITASRSYRIEGYVENFEVTFCFVPDQNNGLKEASGFIRVIPKTGMESRRDNLFFPVNVSPSAIQKKMREYFKKYSVKPTSKVAALDFYGGKAVDKETNSRIVQLFEKKGWDLAKNQFYQTSGSQFTKDQNQISALSGNEKSKNPISNAEYTERYCPAKENMKFGFYIDFCVSFTENTKLVSDTQSSSIQGGNMSSGKMKYNGFAGWNTQYMWLVVKPAKQNQNGSLTRYYYPASMSLSDIYKNMANICK